MTILEQIVGTKKEEIARMGELPPPRTKMRSSFLAALRASKPAFIAEVKPKSPSGGTLISLDQVPDLVKVYDRSATAISVLCDASYFGGGYDLLAQVASLTPKPLLAKEFIIDEKQITLAVSHGASAVLLIAAILDAQTMAKFITTAVRSRCDVLLELHDTNDLSKVVLAFDLLSEEEKGHVIIGINNRALDSLAVDIAQTERLAPLIRERLGKDRLIISESGIDSAKDCLRLRPFVDGFLIGTSILRSPDPELFLSSLVSALPPHVKFCGMTRREDILAAEDLGVPYIGFVLVPSSPRSVTTEQAEQLRPAVKRSKAVGVFVEENAGTINAAAHVLRLDFVQLHGTPDLKLCAQISVPVIQAFRGVPPTHEIERFLSKCPFILIDKEEGEEKVDLDAVALLPESVRSRLFLAGGLHPENVREAIARVRPYAVDCARGIEKRPGEKDSALMRAFMTHVASPPVPKALP
ncbi:MAG: hypothetical protein V1876_04475 [Candidatus Peregrinibacteria bacterium]